MVRTISYKMAWPTFLLVSVFVATYFKIQKILVHTLKKNIWDETDR